MKRFLTTLTFCAFLLISGAFFLTKSTGAKDDVIEKLLSLPAPPPGQGPKRAARWRLPDRKTPPKDDAPISEILAYWEAQSENYRELGYNPKPTDRVLERIRAEISKKPESVVRFLNIFRESPDGIDLVKRIYDNWPEAREGRSALKSWLTMNSSHFADQLAKTATRAAEQGEYVSNHNELLALAQHDWDGARPTVDRLYSDTAGPVSRVLGMWALYKHALTENSLGDIDRYREELKAVVEDKKATAGMRDLAFDALVKEKDWNGRDEWYYTLLGDETLAELRVNGSLYTGLTTLVMYSHPDKYADKMIELSRSTNSVVRNAAVRNLGIMLEDKNPDVVRALLPWLEDPKWARDVDNTRGNLVRALRNIKMPESVPGLISILDEKETYYVDESMFAANGANVANRVAMAMNAAANAANAAANAVDSGVWASNSVSNRVHTNANIKGSGKVREMTRYPLRSEAIQALAMNSDMRAAQPLKRILRDVEPYERALVVKAILMCKGFTVAEQADAIETFARETTRMKEEAEAYAAAHGPESNLNAVVSHGYSPLSRIGGPVFSAEEMRLLLGMQLLQIGQPDDLLVREVVSRIGRLEKSEPDLAQALRMMILNWKGPAINALLLKDLRDNKSSPEAVVKLLSVRRSLQETQPGDVFEIRTGNSTAAGVSACLLESDRDYASLLAGQDAEAKAAMLACARLIRARLPVRTVAGYLSATDKRLALAAERYLESEDSPEARAILHSFSSNEIRILGATTGFWPDGKYDAEWGSYALIMLGDDGDQPLPEPDPDGYGPAYRYLQSQRVTEFDDIEKRIKEEIKADEKLSAVYAYNDHYVHIFKDKVLFSWDEDESRYRERAMTKAEFEHLTGYLADNKVDELGPFLTCSEDCESEELLMVGRQGGRRVFFNHDTETDFSDGLEAIFTEMKKEPAKLRYRLEKEIPGLEILFADDFLKVETIWKNAVDFRVLAVNEEKRKKIEEESEPEESDEESDEEYVDHEGETGYGVRRGRRFEDHAWYRFDDGKLTDKVLQPEGVDFLPAAGDDQTAKGRRWKTKAAGIEIRSDDEGLSRISAGKTTRLRTGNYDSPVITSNGKWVFTSKFGNDGASLWRINLTTNREYLVESKELPAIRAIAFLPAINKVLITPNYYEGSDEFEDMYVPSARQYLLADPDTGAVQLARGELRPVAQQTFRPLQEGPGQFEFWAAIPDNAGRKTSVGIYSAKTLSFKEVLSVPKITFDSMEMWADPAGGRLYFVYKGHLLALPLPPAKAK